MKKIATILLLLASFFVQDLKAQPCTTHIITDTLICAGTEATLVADVSGPDNVLAASNTAGNNHRGNMFDIVATNAVKILSFDASPMGNTTIEIYYKAGTWNGFANTPSAWTYIGSAPVDYTGVFSPVSVPVNVVIPAGQTYAFYVTSTNTSVSLNYSNGTNVGNVYSSDANITFLEGGGMEYPFTQGTGAVYQPRVWNGNIHYALADLPTTYLWSTAGSSSQIQQTLGTDMAFNVETTITGCPTMHDTAIVHTSNPQLTVPADQSVCIGDSLTLTATGVGSTYAWDNGITNGVAFAPTMSAAYTVVATDTMGCTDTSVVMVTTHPGAVVDAGSDMTICAGDSIVFSAQGSDSYVWNNGVTNDVAFVPMATDTFVVIGTDNTGCANSDTLTVTVNQLPNVHAGSDVEICAGGDIVFTATGAVTYAWNNGVVNGQSFVPAGSGDYIVAGTGANGCVNFDTVTVTVHAIASTLTASGATLQAGPATSESFTWFNCVDRVIFMDAHGSTFTPVTTGSYGVIVEDQFGCTDTSDCQLIDFAGLEEEMLSVFTVYPNPTSGSITVTSAGQAITSVELYDIVGQLIYMQPASGVTITLDLARFQGTQFIAKISNEDGFQLVKVLKQ